MPTSVYFNTGTQREQLLYEDLIIEQLKAFGQDVYYIPRTLVNRDNILNKTNNIALISCINGCIVQPYPRRVPRR